MLPEEGVFLFVLAPYGRRGVKLSIFLGIAYTPQPDAETTCPEIQFSHLGYDLNLVNCRTLHASPPTEPDSSIVTLRPQMAGVVGDFLSYGLSAVVTRSVPQRTHCHADVIYLLPQLEIKIVSRELMVIRAKPIPTRFRANIIHPPVDSKLFYSLSSV